MLEIRRQKIQLDLTLCFCTAFIFLQRRVKGGCVYPNMMDACVCALLKRGRPKNKANKKTTKNIGYTKQDNSTVAAKKTGPCFLQPSFKSSEVSGLPGPTWSAGNRPCVASSM